MTLSVGTRFGSYEIVAPLGAGGMGEVYSARDRKLDRAVAIKILPEVFARDPDRLTRFEREAKTLAALNHPNIAIVHGLEEASGISALVMELVDGPTLADRLAQGRIPIDEALDIAKQIADALEAAHDHGIIHRDLKPANIKLRPDGTAKVLDFGLAKALTADGIGTIAAPLSQSPTITSPVMITGVGIILGTAPYMSPEQAKGRAADKRSDVWAFGCVLFEMLTGTRAFPGDDVSDALAAVLRGEPDWRALPTDTPAPIRRLLHRCLVKDRKRRLDSVSDARLEIEDALAGPATESSAAPTARTRTLIILALTGAFAVTLAAWALRAPRPLSARPPSRVSVSLEPGLHLGEASRELLFQQRPGLTALALSPDGRHLVYVGHDGKTSQLYVRHMDQERAIPLAGTTGAQNPFFSPDGSEVGFFSGPQSFERDLRDSDGALIGRVVDAPGAIRRVALAGGPVRTIEISGPAPRVFPSAAWSADDTILLSGSDGVYRLRAGGGAVERVIAAQPGPSLRFPEPLPGGRSVLFNVLNRNATPSLSDIAVETLDTHERTVLVRGGSFPRFVDSGHIVFARGGKLMAVPFDAATRRVRGDPVVVGEDVMQSEEGGAYFRMNGTAQFAVSRAGDLAYVPGGVYSEARDALMWVDRAGTAAALPVAPAPMSAAAISPDGKQIAWAQGGSRRLAIWLFDIDRGVSRRLTDESMLFWNPAWSPDGRRLATISVDDDGSPVVAVIDVDGGRAPQRLRLDVAGQSVAYWAPGDTVFLQRITAGAPGRLAARSLDATSQVRPLFEWSTQMRFPAFSRDGKWMSYSVNETGAFEVYVRPIPSGTPVVRVSVNGGSSSAWSADGRELFYREGARIMAVPISTDGGFRQLGPPRMLFSGDYVEASMPTKGFEVAPDGRRFLMKVHGRAIESTPVTSINFVMNWAEELTRLAPSR